MTYTWWVLLLSAALPFAAQATELSGIVISEVDKDPPQRRVWHTSLDPAAPPVALAVSIPPASFRLPLVNDGAGEISVPLTVSGPYRLETKNLFTAFWQVDPRQPLTDVAVSFFFNRDTLSPGISVVVPIWAGGFTYFRRNTAPTVLGLYLREVVNETDLQYSDGDNRITLTALLLSNPTPYLPVDRAGFNSLAADHAFDATMIFELSVASDIAPRAPALAPRRSIVPLLQGPLQATIGSAAPGTLPGTDGGYIAPAPGVRPLQSQRAKQPPLPTSRRATSGAKPATPVETEVPTAIETASAEDSAGGETQTPGVTRTPSAVSTGAATPKPRSTTRETPVATVSAERTGTVPERHTTPTSQPQPTPSRTERRPAP